MSTQRKNMVSEKKCSEKSILRFYFELVGFLFQNFTDIFIQV